MSPAKAMLGSRAFSVASLTLRIHCPALCILPALWCNSEINLKLTVSAWLPSRVLDYDFNWVPFMHNKIMHKMPFFVFHIRMFVMHKLVSWCRTCRCLSRIAVWSLLRIAVWSLLCSIFSQSGTAIYAISRRAKPIHSTEIINNCWVIVTF